jgi:mRNA-degrading endonuclease RelE of RelBE toxin-antitoxin system
MPRYHIGFKPEAKTDLKAMRKFDVVTVLDSIERHLRYEPTKESNSITRMRQPELAQYSLRVGKFRVYYDVADNPDVVSILRICDKGSKTTSETLS